MVFYSTTCNIRSVVNESYIIDVVVVFLMIFSIDCTTMPSDVILSITVDGSTQEITRRYQVIDTLLNARPGSKVVFKILRAGAEMSIELAITTEMLVEYK